MSKSATLKSNAATRKAAVASARKARTAKKTTYVVVASVVILGIGGLIIAAQPGAFKNDTKLVASRQPVPSRSAGHLVAPQETFNFGAISMAGGKVKHRYAIRNAGTEPLVIRKIYTSCMCTTAALVKNGKKSDAFGMPGHTPIPTIDVPLNPGEEGFIEVVFDPAAHGPAGVGPIERVVTVENSAGQPLELEFAALVSP